MFSCHVRRQNVVFQHLFDPFDSAFDFDHAWTAKVGSSRGIFGVDLVDYAEGIQGREGSICVDVDHSGGRLAGGRLVAGGVGLIDLVDDDKCVERGYIAAAIGVFR